MRAVWRCGGGTPTWQARETQKEKDLAAHSQSDAHRHKIRLHCTDQTDYSPFLSEMVTLSTVTGRYAPAPTHIEGLRLASGHQRRTRRNMVDPEPAQEGPRIRAGCCTFIVPHEADLATHLGFSHSRWRLIRPPCRLARAREVCQKLPREGARARLGLCDRGHRSFRQSAPVRTCDQVL